MSQRRVRRPVRRPGLGGVRFLLRDRPVVPPVEKRTFTVPPVHLYAHAIRIHHRKRLVWILEIYHLNARLLGRIPQWRAAFLGPRVGLALSLQVRKRHRVKVYVLLGNRTRLIDHDALLVLDPVLQRRAAVNRRLANADRIGIYRVVLVRPVAPAGHRVAIGLLVVQVDRRVPPVNHDARVAAFDYPRVRVPALLVRHRLAHTVAAAEIAAALKELVRVPGTVVRRPAGYVTGPAPEHKAMIILVKPHHDIRVVGHLPLPVPFQLVLQGCIVRTEPTLAFRARGQPQWYVLLEPLEFSLDGSQFCHGAFAARACPGSGTSALGNRPPGTRLEILPRPLIRRMFAVKVTNFVENGLRSSSYAFFQPGNIITCTSTSPPGHPHRQHGSRAANKNESSHRVISKPCRCDSFKPTRRTIS